MSRSQTNKLFQSLNDAADAELEIASAFNKQAMRLDMKITELSKGNAAQKQVAKELSEIKDDLDDATRKLLKNSRKINDVVITEANRR
jgi:exonuclease VII small subunit